jgi:hypothetical protein
LYDSPSALSLIEPWLCQHLPDLESAVRRRFIQLVTGIFETRSLLIDTIADSSAFRATATSNATQVRRILRDLRLTLETVYYPFIRSILAAVPATDLYLTVDETSHGTDYNVVQVGWATDGMSLPLGMVIYAPDAAWAEDTRALLHTIDTLIPDGMTVTLLADRIHTGEPFLACLDTLHWNFVFRASETTQIDHPTKGWMPLRRVYKRANTGRYFAQVRLWKQGQRRANVSSGSGCGRASDRSSGIWSPIVIPNRANFTSMPVVGGVNARSKSSKAASLTGNGAASRRRSGCRCC